MKIMLTFDLEEFDLPREFNIFISEERMFSITKKGVYELKRILDKHNVRATFFTTANFAKKYPSLVKELSQRHEIACHGFSHSDDYSEDISNANIAKKEIEQIICKSISGFRAPRFKIKKIESLHDSGFKYDSSVNPTIAPGKYCNLSEKRVINKKGKILEIPLSTLPLFPFLRAPMNWYSFRIFPTIYSKIHTLLNNLTSTYQMLLIHPWEFVDLRNSTLPNEFRKNTGKVLSRRLENYIKFCKKKNFQFLTIKEFLKI